MAECEHCDRMRKLLKRERKINERIVEEFKPLCKLLRDLGALAKSCMENVEAIMDVDENGQA